MTTEYRIILTATFSSEAERDKAYNSLKTVIASTVSKVAAYKRADLTKDSYFIPDQATERVI